MRTSTPTHKTGVVRPLTTVVAAASLLSLLSGSGVEAADCTFTTIGTRMFLDADCRTGETIVVPPGFRFVGQHNTMTAVDPLPGHFVAGLSETGATVAPVTQLLVNVIDLADDFARSSSFPFLQGSLSVSGSRMRNRLCLSDASALCGAQITDSRRSQQLLIHYRFLF